MYLKKTRQKGIALYVVIVLVMLSSLLALWASRTALFNELIIGNDADYQRATEAAQAMLQDAEMDIRQGQEASLSNNRVTNGKTLFPTDQIGVELLADTLDAQTSTLCFHAICQKRVGAQNFWDDSTRFDAMTASNIGARYGQYTGASAGATSNPILANTTAGQGAWYWIEVMKYTPKTGSSGLVAGVDPEPVNAPLLYRITAIARGLKPATQVVLQSVVAFPSISGE